MHFVALNSIKRFWRKTYHCLVALVYILGGLTVSTPASAADCQAVQFIFARGSGEARNGPSYNAWRTAIEQRMKRSTISYSFYELGSQAQAGHQYPATAVSGNIGGVTNLIGAAISGGELFKFGRSVDEGAAELKAYFSSVSQRCPGTKFVLGGYSQGAMLISRTLGELDASKIIYVSTFGDPKLYLPEGKKRLLRKPEACYGRNLSNYRINVMDCYAYEGVLGSYRPYQTEAYIDKLGTWCNRGDIMCSSRINTSDHTSYVSENLYDEAAAIIVAKVSDFFGTYITSSPNAMHEVAFLVDNTGSMKTEHDQYRDTIGKFAERVIKSGGRIALFEFGDLAQNVKTFKRCGFGCTVDEFKQGYNSIGTQGGGDNPESALSGLMTTMDSLEWTNGATKSIVLLTDAGYHDPDIDGIILDDVVRRSLEIDPVNIYVIDTGDETKKYSELITRTNGGLIKSGADVDDLSVQLLSRPIARLKLMDYQAEIGSLLEFDASDSFAEDGNELTFDWDLDGDGIFEQLNKKAIAQYTYNQPFDGFVQVRVSNQTGYAATMSAHVKVSNEETMADAPKIVNFSSQRIGSNNQITFSTTGARVLLASEETVVGWVDVSTGGGEIDIAELEEDTNFTLIPYSAGGERGEAYEFTLSADVASANKNTSVNSRQNSTHSILPKVPNAGVFASDR